LFLTLIYVAASDGRVFHYRDAQGLARQRVIGMTEKQILSGLTSGRVIEMLTCKKAEMIG